MLFISLSCVYQRLASFHPILHSSNLSSLPMSLCHHYNSTSAQLPPVNAKEVPFNQPQPYLSSITIPFKYFPFPLSPFHSISKVVVVACASYDLPYTSSTQSTQGSTRIRIFLSCFPVRMKQSASGARVLIEVCGMECWDRKSRIGGSPALRRMQYSMVWYSIFWGRETERS